MFYVYAHKKPCGEVFYIGKGKNRRAWSKYDRNSMWVNTANKYGYTVEIIHDNLTEQEAFDKEVELIRKYGRRNIGTGILTNLTDGGEGVTGHVHSEEYKALMSVKAGRAKNGNADKREYTFINLTTGEEITGVRADVEDRLGFYLRDLFSGEATTVFGWSLKGKEVKSRQDHNLYTFCHFRGEQITCTRKEFKERVGFDPKQMFGRYEWFRGWTYLGRTDTVKEEYKIHIFEHDSGEIFTGTRKDMTEQHVDPKSLFGVNAMKKCYGWKIKEKFINKACILRNALL